MILTRWQEFAHGEVMCLEHEKLFTLEGGTCTECVEDLCDAVEQAFPSRKTPDGALSIPGDARAFPYPIGIGGISDEPSQRKRKPD